VDIAFVSYLDLKWESAFPELADIQTLDLETVPDAHIIAFIGSDKRTFRIIRDHLNQVNNSEGNISPEILEAFYKAAYPPNSKKDIIVMTGYGKDLYTGQSIAVPWSYHFNAIAYNCASYANF